MTSESLQELSAAILALHECTSPDEIGPALAQAMRALFRNGRRAMNAGGPGASSGTSAEIAEHSAGELVLRWTAGETHATVQRAVRLSETAMLRRFQQTALYRHLFQQMVEGRHGAITLPISAEGVLALACSHDPVVLQPSAPPLLELLAPHVQYVIGRLKGRLEMENTAALRELAANGQAVLIVDDTGGLCFASERAQRLLREYFPMEMAVELPAPLRAWLARDPRAGGHIVQAGPGGELSIECLVQVPAMCGPDRALTLHHLKLSGLRLLRFTERPGAPSISRLRRLGLTTRQAEVLHWMAQGKRNDEIAIILGTSPRTVDKHRENLFARLDVETRTAAVAAAWEMLADEARAKDARAD